MSREEQIADLERRALTMARFGYFASARALQERVDRLRPPAPFTSPSGRR